MSNTDDQRQAFEKWFIEAYQRISLTRFQHPQHDGDPLPYRSDVCNAAWVGWQAAIEHAKKTMCNRN